MALSENQIECLEGLAYITDHPRCPMPWARPLDIGGHNGSHHSNTLGWLAKHGLVRFKFRGTQDPPAGENGKRFFASRGAKVYQIADAGRSAIATPSPETNRA